MPDWRVLVDGGYSVRVTAADAEAAKKAGLERLVAAGHSVRPDTRTKDELDTFGKVVKAAQVKAVEVP